MSKHHESKKVNNGKGVINMEKESNKRVKRINSFLNKSIRDASDSFSGLQPLELNANEKDIIKKYKKECEEKKLLYFEDNALLTDFLCNLFKEIYKQNLLKNNISDDDFLYLNTVSKEKGFSFSKIIEGKHNDYSEKQIRDLLLNANSINEFIENNDTAIRYQLILAFNDPIISNAIIDTIGNLIITLE